MRHVLPVILLLLLPAAAPAVAVADDEGVTYDFALTGAECRSATTGNATSALVPCRLAASGHVRFVGCEQGNCTLEMLGHANGSGAPVGLPRLDLRVMTVVLGSLGGGTTHYLVCDDADALRELRCGGAVRWSTRVYSGDCLPVTIMARYRNVADPTGLFWDRPGLVQHIEAARTWELCRSEDGQRVTFEPYVYVPPPPPQLAIPVPEGHYVAFRVNLSDATDLTFSTTFRVAGDDDSQTPRPIAAWAAQIVDGEPHAWLGYPHSGHSSGLNGDPVASANVLGTRASLAPSAEAFSGGSSGSGGTWYFRHWQDVPDTLTVVYWGNGGAASLAVDLPHTYGLLSYDWVVGPAFALTKEDFATGAHATVSQPVGPGLSAGAGLAHAIDVQGDALAVWTPANRIDELGTTTSSCVEDGAPCEDSWQGISVLRAHGPERWEFAIDADARVENERYVLYGFELPDDSYFYALDETP